MDDTQAPRRIPEDPRQRMSSPSKSAAKAAFLGFAVDYYDIYLPVVALAPADAYFQSPAASGALSTTLFYLTFAVTLLGRPIGSAIFGSLSDKIGRRRATLFAVAGFTVATLLIAALPGYASWGYGSLCCLMALRLVGGVFMGGEYTSANPLALESCPKQKRGIIGALIGAAYPVGYIAISVVTLPLLEMLPGQGLTSPYVQWGWRVPFLVGGALGIVFFWYFRRCVGESQAWEHTVERQPVMRQAPLRQLLAGRHPRRLAQTLILMTGLWFAVQSIISPMSGLLITQLKQSPGAVTTALLIANAALFVGYLVLGHLGQKYGRRKVLLLSGAATATVSAAAFLTTILILRGGGNFAAAMVAYTICLVVAIGPYGVATVYLLETFPTAIRASGYGVAYSFSLIIPSFYSFYMLGLSVAMPYAYTPLVLIVLAGVLTAAGAWMGPETKDVDFGPVQA